MGKSDIIKSFYEHNIGKDMPDHEVLGWESQEAQNRRFEVLVSNVDIQGKKLLDVGCGLGNLLEFLNKKGIEADYTGVDICDKMIDCVRKKDLNASFHCTDIFKDDSFEENFFDVVFTSGIFNINLGNNKEFLQKALIKLFSLSNSIVAFNLLHHNSPDREDRFYYFSPDEVEGILKNAPYKLKKVKFVEGYLLNDFTVICEKE